MKRKIFLAVLTACAAAFAGMFNAEAAGKNKILVVYYSRSGNTKAVANLIKQATGADILEIQTVTPYPADYRTTTEQAKKELADGYRPKLKNSVTNMAQYNTIILGSPCWWGTVAMPVMTFLESYDFSGKTIAPFITHAGSRLGSSVSDIKKMCPKATVTKGLSVRGTGVKDAADDVKDWLKQTGIIK